MEVCSVENCNVAIKARKLCRRHYIQNYRKKRGRTYAAWCEMRSRVTNTTRPSAKYYYYKGITLCERWEFYWNFLEDMGECPEGLTLERIDNDEDYFPANCKWATRQEQNRNYSRNKLTKEKVINLKKEARSQVQNSENYRILAERYGIAIVTVYNIMARRVWKDIE